MNAFSMKAFLDKHFLLNKFSEVPAGEGAGAIRANRNGVTRLRKSKLFFIFQGIIEKNLSIGISWKRRDKTGLFPDAVNY
jgi:hypothetical protein